MRSRFLFVQTTLLALILTSVARADSAAFDLPGPRVEVMVDRVGKELPIAKVPNLQTGDRLWVHPNFPDSQTAHYLLIVAFLRGSTNPPPEDWFIRAETWNKKVRQEGILVTVPKGAEQALLFLAPETGGDFSTLRSAVRGRPGAFVRASQDLNQASLDRSRLDAYLTAVKQASNEDPKELHAKSVLLARSLNIKLDSQCFDKPSEQQAPCLMQNTDQLILDDPHSQSMVAALTSGPSADLIGQLSTTRLAGGGYYSAYVGAVVDVAKLLTALHTAVYQYIPALALPQAKELNLKLNTPPSFRNPKSVLVIGLPAVEAAQLPPLRPVDPKQVSCLEKPSLVLPAEGAPLIFSTSFGHDFAFHTWSKSGKTFDLPIHADASRGGFVVDTHGLKHANLDSEMSGTLRGYWGFEAFEGPTFHLQVSHPVKWTLVPADRSALIVGREDMLHLQSNAATCVDDITVHDHTGKKLDSSWKLSKPEEIEIKVSLKDAAPGAATMEVKQAGLSEAERVSLQTYAEAGHLDSLIINSGDRQALLKGTRLDEVAGVQVNGVHFAPSKLTRDGTVDQLFLAAATPISPLQPQEKITAHVALKDGRDLALQTTVEPPRPKVLLISKSIQSGREDSSAGIHMVNQDVLPQNARLSFCLKSQIPDTFSREEKIEIATEDNSVHTLLSFADGSLNFQDSKTVMGVLDPLKAFGPAAFGQLRFRPVGTNGAKGDWQPLITLVRVPTLKEVRCPDSPDRQCTLSGSNLYLIDSIASDPQFKISMSVPEGFADPTISVPRPNGTLLYIRLRDDPLVVNKAALPVLPEQ
ncbi:MAG TPA: hypothetical protein VFC29_20420 [Candidatus Limnocylindrales bacterium]|nr:hypothetical protein [Candidatus Limnocylindrales bacterium]